MTGYVRQRSPGHWEISYELAADPLTGKRRRASNTVRGTRKEAERELRQRLVAVDTGVHVDPHRISVKDWLTTWLAAVRQEVAPKTAERYEDIALNIIGPALGNFRLAKLTPLNIQEAYNGWAISGRRDGKEGGFSPQTRRHIHRTLSLALERAVGLQLIVRNPCETFKKRLPVVERREMSTLDIDQAKDLLAAVHHTRVYWPVLIALATGMRRGEILALRWRNVESSSGIIRVVESLEQTKQGLRFKPPKNGKSRVVTIPSFATEELGRLKREQAEELLSMGIRQTGATLLCARADGEPMQPRSLTHEFTRLVSRLDALPRVRFHDLRHSHATQLLNARVHPKIAQERLGHSSISITLDLYSHVTESIQEDAAVQIDDRYRASTRSAPATTAGPVRARRQIRRQGPISVRAITKKNQLL
jgi:integrase